MCAINKRNNVCAFYESDHNTIVMESEIQPLYYIGRSTSHFLFLHLQPTMDRVKLAIFTAIEDSRKTGGAIDGAV